jgi:hypothetical protein
MTGPMTEQRQRTRTFKLVLIWAIVATLLGLIATGVATFLFLQRSPDHGAAGWLRWEKSAGGNGHWYKAVLLPAASTWTETEELARSQGGYLATVLSEAENQFVFSLINRPEFFTALNGSGPALGAFQQDGAPEPNGGWCWVNGDPWSHSNWFPGEPNNGRSVFGTENRVHYYSGKGRTPADTWNDVNRGDKSSPLFSYVMERNE